MATAPDDTTKFLKVPPHSLEAEASVLGGLLLDDAAWDAIAGIIGPDDFYLGDHRSIFRCMQSLAEQDKPIDVITVSDALEEVSELQGLGGLSYISQLASNTPTASNIRAYAEIVQERATVRKLIAAANEIADSGFNTQGRDSATLINEAESKGLKLEMRGQTGVVLNR